MRNVIASIVAAGITLSVGIVPAVAGPLSAPAMTVPTAAPVGGDIVQVRDHHGGHWHHHRHFHSGNDNYYNDYDDSGVLFKSFVTGTLFRHDNGAAYYSGHARDCASRYRSYDPADNTYQPSHGPRTQCR